MVSFELNMINIIIILCIFPVILTQETKLFQETVIRYFAGSSVKSVDLFYCGEEEVDLKVLYKTGPMIKSIKLHVMNKKNKTNYDYINVLQGGPMYNYPLGLFIDIACEEGISLLNEFSLRSLLSMQFYFLLYGDQDASLQVLNEMKLSLHSFVSLITPDRKIFSLYKLYFDTSLIMENIDSHISTDDIIRKRLTKKNFVGYTMNVTFVFPDLNFVKDHSIEFLLDHSLENNKLPLFRLYLRDFENLKQMLNLTYNYAPVDSWGWPDGKGGFTGMMGRLKDGTSELGMTQVAIQLARLPAMDYSHQNNVDKIIFTFLQPRSFGSYKALAVPFTFSTWISYFSINLIFFISFRFFALYELSLDIKEWAGNFELIVRTLSQQGIEDTLKLSSSKLVTSSLLLLSFIAYSYYNAAILNGFLSPSTSTINSKDDLIKSGMPVILHDAPYCKDRSNGSVFGTDSPFRRRLFAVMSKQTGQPYYTTKEGLAKVATGKSAMVIHEMSMYDDLQALFTEAQVCSSDNIVLSLIQVGFVTSKKSTFKEPLRQAFSIMHERGLLMRSRTVWYTPKPECIAAQEAISIGLPSLIIAYSMLLLGIPTAILIFLIEVITRRFKTNQYY